MGACVIDILQNRTDVSLRREFAIEEWKSTRNQVHILLQAIWKLELYALSGFALYYSWFLSQDKKLYVYEFAAYVPCIYLFGIIWRLKVEYGILMKLGDYSRRLESSIYGKWDNEVKGWEHSIFQPNQGPDKISWTKVTMTYKNTFCLFSTLLLISLYGACVITGHGAVMLTLLYALLPSIC